jgi:tRNA threonylcarbamoyladenosine biosynthesis protein TsaE
MQNKTKIIIKTAAAMQKLGAKLAKTCQPGSVIYLLGELGAGKTTLARGFLRQLGVTEQVRSPTFTLVEPYPVVFGTVYHFDLYRLADGEEFYYLGGDDYFTSASICLIEWPERALGFIPQANIICQIDFNPDGGRIVEVLNTG